MRLLRRLRAERGYSLVEMITVMVIMSIVMTGITTVFVQGSNAELDMNNRFQAQTNARIGLDKIRKDVHTGCTLSPAQSGSAVASVTLTEPPVVAGVCSVSVSWCAVTVSGNTGLYRQAGASCGSASPAIRQVDRLTKTGVFTVQAQVDNTDQNAKGGTLASLYVDISVNTGTTKHVGIADTYRLCDGIVLRNSTRGLTPWISAAGTTLSPPAGC